MKILKSILIIVFFTINICKAQQDTIPPEITLIGAPCIKICVGATFADSGFVVANDSIERDLTITQEGSFVTFGTANTGYYKLRYKAVDKGGNIGYTGWRKIQVVNSANLPNCQPVAVDCNTMDTIPPVITLIGDPAASVCKCNIYRDAGYKVSDNKDSVKGIIITAEGSFLKDSTKNEGVYALRYKAIDKAGNISYSEYRYILVRNPFEFPCKADPRFDPCTGKPISIKEDINAGSKLSIYPNPAENELFIETSAFVNLISIYNISGQKLSEISISQNLNLPYKIDTKHFPAGVYMVQVKSASGIIHKKVQIIR